MKLRSILFFAAVLPVFSQQGPSASPDLKIGDVTVYGSVRVRGSVWDWFQGNADNEYAFSESYLRFGFKQTSRVVDWNLEFATPVLLDLPNDAVAAGAQGQQGFGANYYVANKKSTDAAMIFAKQGYLVFHPESGAYKQSFKIGRTEFSDGAEMAPKNKTVAAVIKTRVTERLIGNFGFSDVGRSFDGIVYSGTEGNRNLTLMATRPTRGVFQVDGWGEVNINLFYGAFTQQVGSAKDGGEFRAFAIGYDDGRDSTAKTDNRPAAAKAIDHQNIEIGTYGADYVHSVATGVGTLDVLGWGVLQYGSWGVQKDRAYAYVAEGGWQAPGLGRLKPWLRGGYDYGSGDKNPNDSTHTTFFQILPTARVFARFPLCNMMNMGDAFAELVLRPAKILTIRSDAHNLQLASANDLWYQGGGAFQPWTFGYTGRTSSGKRDFGNLYDVSADITLGRGLALSTYYGHLAGGAVTNALYPKDGNANLGFIELDYTF